MIQITPQMRVLVAVEAVDFRKGIDSLAQLCRDKLAADPFSGCVFVFRSRRATSIKALVYDGMGFWLATKRLSKGRFRWWPEGETARELQAHQSSPRHLGARDRYIGWNQETRRQNLHLIAYNTRFLILPWMKVPHLASHILGRMAARISADWEARYAHPIYLLETFVDPQQFRGTCYLAANWKVLGETTGRGKDDQTHRPNRSIKQVLALPLHRRFRERLSEAVR
jgi:transposase